MIACNNNLKVMSADSEYFEAERILKKRLLLIGLEAYIHTTSPLSVQINQLIVK